MNEYIWNRVLITGCGGMLGSSVGPYFAERCKVVVCTDKRPGLRPLDVRDRSALHHVFAELRPDLVLHLAAETDLEFCEANSTAALETNAEATQTIADLSDAVGATMVYVSTAGVFDGLKTGPYVEKDSPNPINLYGITKLAGEHHVRESCARHYIVRAGWMIGGGPGKDHKFVSLILGQIGSGASLIHAVDDKIGTPTYGVDFVCNLFRLLQTKRYGTYHMVGNGSGSRLDVAREILAILGRTDIELKAVPSDYFAERYSAKRPRSEWMQNAGLQAIDLDLMRPWRIALRDYLKTWGAP